jgi:hypothetical protein
MAVNQQAACMVADRRLTAAGKPVPEEMSKTAWAWFPHGSFMVAFHGIARVRGVPTIDWFSRALFEIAEQGYRIEDVLTTVTKVATRDFARLRHPASDKRLSVVGVGFVDARPSPQPTMWRITNFQEFDHSGSSSAWPEFRYHSLEAGHVDGKWNAFVYTLGSVSSTPG